MNGWWWRRRDRKRSLGDTAVAVHPEDPRFAHLIGKQSAASADGSHDPGDRRSGARFDGVWHRRGQRVTPGHDFNDFETGLRHNLDQISVFDLGGKLNEHAPERFRGLTIAESRKAVLEALAEAGLLVEEKAHKLNLGRCQRCDTVIEPMLSLQWFVKTEPLAKAGD